MDFREYLKEDVIKKDKLQVIKDFCNTYRLILNEKTGFVFKDKAAFLSLGQFDKDGKLHTSNKLGIGLF